jgi:hypothetical protein
VRHAGPQGAQERGPGLAHHGRSGSRDPAAGLTTEAETILRLAGAIVLETCALAVWNVGTRSPAIVVRDVLAALRSPKALAAGAFSAFVGMLFVAAATVMLLPIADAAATDFVPLSIYTFVTALAVELLVGNDLRAVATRFAGAPSKR